MVVNPLQAQSEQTPSFLGVAFSFISNKTIVPRTDVDLIMLLTQ